MPDTTLSNGREITFDLSKLTIREYRALFDPKQPRSAEDEIVSRVAGLTIDEYLDLSYNDWRQMTLAFFKRAKEPINPN